MTTPERQLVGFARFLRAHGLRVGMAEQADALRAAAGGSLLDRRRLYWELRGLFCASRRDWEDFERLFEAYWGRDQPRGTVRHSGKGGRRASGGQGPNRARLAREAAAGEGAEGESATAPRGGASRGERLAGTDFRDLTEGEEMEAVGALAERLARRMQRRPSARWRPSPRGRRIHMRRTLRASLRYGGVPLRPVRARRRLRPPRLVLLLDASRSMELYSFFFLRFARGLLGVFPRAEAFVFHTRLVRASDALRQRDFTRARERLALRSAGWGGGTRIAESLAAFRHTYGGRMLDRRTVVVIVSDGLETGDPAELGEELRRIRGRARRVVWLNPLLGRAGYEPTAAGMAAALPWLDLFAPAHNLESLASLEDALTRL
ncbi:vWA domain-containing protein [Thiohalorhabdus sp. Cl-TMA]|uniref:VWA domain-containing protein n=1 Tax=Thiohalorhabdus methylotrophus TaxID=3242694 RepID=A0ABV4TRH7_9GAMM